MTALVYNRGVPVQKRPPAREGVNDHVVSSARELLATLRPEPATWAGDPLKWIFRGHADAAWELKPKAVRGGGVALTAFFHDMPPPSPGTAITWNERKSRHDALIERFRQGLHRSGLTVPVESPPVTEPPMIARAMSQPSRWSLPVVALAQHHGLPTMLMDWSRRPLVAAYFAAEDVVMSGRRRRQSDYMAVWALENTQGWPSEPFRSRPLVYEPPGDTNPNLHAQAGLFTEHPAPFTANDGDEDVALDVYLSLVARKWPRPELRRYFLHRAEALQLLRLLAFEGVTGASLFPNPDGVARGLREEALWRTLDKGESRKPLARLAELRSGFTGDELRR